MSAYRRSPVSNDMIEEFLGQLMSKEAGLSKLALIFFAIKVVCVTVLCILWYRNDDRDRLIAANQAQANQAQKDKEGVNV